ncbi:alpha/beta hydrolase [Actinoplanes sp. NBRC 103695]|uniref:alpha/beta fold hydrolase n=1 Tax=Actinoplanes sp. NBRC 103695 TaxID=3032202 RepID=UPI0024A158AD|nr:alpha/beta hydrolase [Actinoplanes sp. NBRC 103695]GLY93360.1 hydrolase [Actinoplanes sp. NBRC 103695]
MRTPIHVTVWDGPAAATPAILVHGTFTWATHSFEHQRPLAAARRVLLPDRRGFGASPDLEPARPASDPGASPDTATSDYAVDAADVVELMGGGAHLVGHSYGGTVAMLAAAARPDLVRSLTLIEPCAHMVAADDPGVARSIEDGRRYMAGARRGTPDEYIAAAYGDRPRPAPEAWLRRAAATALHERPCWLADLATEPLRAAGFPKLVIVGGWETIPPGYRPGMATLMRTVCARVADRIDARLAHIPGAAHEPQRDQPEALNALLTELWADRPPATSSLTAAG